MMWTSLMDEAFATNFKEFGSDGADFMKNAIL